MIGGAVVPRSAGGTDVLVGVIFTTRAFGCGKLERETDRGAIVFADELAISRPRECLCTFRRNLFRAVGVFVTDPLADEAGRARALVVPKGIISRITTRLAVVRRGALRLRRSVKGGGRVNTGITATGELELEKAFLVLVHRNDSGRVRSMFATNIDVEAQDGREVVQKLTLVSKKTKVGSPHTFPSGTLAPADPFQVLFPS